MALLYGRESCVRMEFDGSTRTSNVERTIAQAERLKEHGVVNDAVTRRRVTARRAGFRYTSP
ncbi:MULTISPECIES: hypothetical protein [unclassified Caballeronia]|uniref:hypothetical protein n=1 Tax=unclassified Caballeronia TaxID=2646786 RepID=UPI00285D9E69|nr:MULTISPECIES: hypothetical protein [unclassified Caballeronia]MDR5754401.1 hypothetical protein [Caballeronia sp. LZ024]MDR5840779.1 hypothetical protein [Caballeronia sp. LZ031]